MHKMSLRSLLILIFIVSAAFSLSCAKKDNKLKIGLSFPNMREGRWVRDKNLIEEISKKKKAVIYVQICDNDPSKQLSQCENLFERGINVLIIAPCDPFSSSEIAEKAHAAKIKVISYDKLIMNSDIDLFISFDNYRIGQLQGEYLVKNVPNGNYVILSGSPTDGNTKMYYEGAMSIIQPLADKKDINIVMDQFVKEGKASEARRLIEQSLIAQNNKIDAVLAPDDSIAGGCILAIEEQNLTGKIFVTGQNAETDAVIRILKNKQSMTVFKDTRVLAKTAFDLSLKMFKNKTIQTQTKINNGKSEIPYYTISDLATVDASNIDKILVESGFLKMEDIYKK